MMLFLCSGCSALSPRRRKLASFLWSSKKEMVRKASFASQKDDGDYMGSTW
jgi:hypothetical protein